MAPTEQALDLLRLLMILLLPTFGRPDDIVVQRNTTHHINMQHRLHTNYRDLPTTPTVMLVLMSAFLQ